MKQNVDEQILESDEYICMTEVAVGRMTCSDAQRVASTVNEGDQLSDLRNIGNSGKNNGNMNRDFLRMAKKNLRCQLPEFYEANIEMLNREGDINYN